MVHTTLKANVAELARHTVCPSCSEAHGKSPCPNLRRYACPRPMANVTEHKCNEGEVNQWGDGDYKCEGRVAPWHWLSVFFSEAG